ncbi:MAG: ABC transporter permease [Bryobacteraceae bacterium]
MKHLWRLLTRSRRDHELDQELAAHFAMAVRDRMERGEDRKSAEEAARREFGNRLLVREATRDAWGWTWAETLGQDNRYALRALRKSAGFTTVAVLSLALGIGANTAIFSLINSLVLRTLPVSHPEQLLHVSIGKKVHFTNPIWEQLRDSQDVFSGTFAIGRERFNLSAGGEARYVQVNFASGQFFETLGLPPLIGRTFSMADDQRGCPGTAVLAYDFWQSEYGGRGDVVGKTIAIDHHAFQILGVVGTGFTGVDVGSSTEFYVPICAERILRGEASILDHRRADWLRVIGRTKPGVSATQAEARLRTLASQIFEATIPANLRPEERESYRKSTFDTKPAANGLSTIRRDYQKALLVLMGIAGVVLLIACVNVANLLLARGAARQKEIAIRMALGSGRGRLIRQLLTESLMLSLAGAALGVLFAQWGAGMLVGFLSSNRNQAYLDLSIDSRVLAFTAGVAILTGILFGLAPAWKGTGVNPQSAMRANAGGVLEGGRFGIGKALVVGQVALSLILVVGAGLLISTFFRLETLDAGFEREHVLLVNADLPAWRYPAGRRRAVFGEMLQKLRTLPGVRSASISDATPTDGSLEQAYLRVDGYTPTGREDRLVYMNAVSDRFFETLGTDLVAGRDFNMHDTPESPLVAVVNQSMANRFFAGQNPIGKTYRPEGVRLLAPVEIVGVVKDAKYTSLREEIHPTVYVPTSQIGLPGRSITFELRAAASPANLISAVKPAIGEVNRDVNFQFKTLTAQVDESLARERLLATLSGFFGALALLLAVIGLYGVMSYNVARRRGEIGIRMALGAGRWRVLRMVLKEVAMLIGAGLVIGLGVAVGATRFLESFLYGMKANDPWTIASAAGLLGLAAVVAGYLPARSASRLEPMSALRDE